MISFLIGGAVHVMTTPDIRSEEAGKFLAKIIERIAE